MAHSTPRPSGTKSPRKTKKPPFPLRLHATGQWTKKVRGRSYYFGTDRDAALTEYSRVREDLEAGRMPKPADGSRVTLLRAVNEFLTHKTHQVKTGELGSRSFGMYYDSCEGMLAHFGKTVFVDQLTPADLLAYRHKLAKTRNATSIANEVTRARTVFRFAFENGLIDRPVRFGEFKRPAKSVMRRDRAAKGIRMFEPTELRRILAEANPQIRAMILLAVNCGFGNSDVITLPISAVDLAGGWINYPRPKTGIERRCPLWMETVIAMTAVLGKRKCPKDGNHADVFFISQRSEPWATGTRGSSGVTHEFRKVLDKLKLYRPGLSFYTLRHVFQTVADETGDYLATKRIMGHADHTIGNVYRERFADERLRKVTDHVRTWLYGEGGA
jgi:site-specific recombinase XerD